MAKYRMIGSQQAAAGDRIDRVVVDSKTLELDGEPVSLTDNQVEKIAPYVKLERLDEDGEPEAAESAPAADEPPKETTRTGSQRQERKS